MPKGYPSGALVGGIRGTGADGILSGYVFQSGIHSVEHSNVLAYKYPQYYLTSLLERLDRFQATPQEVFSWSIMDRTRQGSVVSNLANGTTATATFETTYPWTATQKGYLIVGDTIRLESGELGRVVASRQGTTATDKQQVDVVRVKGGNWSTALIVNTDKFGHIANLFGEGSMGPDGRLYLPTEAYNRLSILRRAIKITGTELTNKTILNDGSWYWVQEELEKKEFARDRELSILFGQLNDSAVKSSRGVFDYVDEFGIKKAYTTSTVETDIQDMVKDLMIEGVSNDIVVLCGADAMMDVQRGLKAYSLQGGVDFGKFGGNEFGIDVDRYRILGKVVHFVYYELFNDTAVLPVPERAVSADIKNYSKMMLWLDMGDDSAGEANITLKYKELDGMQRKFIQKVIPGMMDVSGEAGGIASNSYDGVEIQLLSDIGTKYKFPNRSGILRISA